MSQTRKNLIHRNEGFVCLHCGFENVPQQGSCRNHCVRCLYSRHVDELAPGDRASECKGLMEPIGLDIPKKGEQPINKAQMEMTLDVMANSLVYWTQDLFLREFLVPKGRIFAMTSSGGNSTIPYYGAVSAAKSALESHCRQLSAELGDMEIAVNPIMAGVTDTPALRKIPGNPEMIEVARRKNPRNRLTTPEDVAKVISILCLDGGEWISGGVINADGGEDVVSYVGQRPPSNDSLNV